MSRHDVGPTALTELAGELSLLAQYCAEVEHVQSHVLAQMLEDMALRASVRASLAARELELARTDGQPANRPNAPGGLS